MGGSYVDISVPNILTIWIIAAIGMIVMGAVASALRQYGT